MEPIHNGHPRFAKLPRLEPRLYPVSISIHKNRQRTNDHSERVPIPTDNLRPKYCHILCGASIRSFDKEQNHRQHGATKRYHIQDVVSMFRKVEAHCKIVEGKLYSVPDLN